ncbi:serine protease [Acrocarpospora macrocephala]|uniref:Serine protease n=1 Tax=Acrocarpospora macrocephala TaxID=150177 RepID=A0A5M3WG47_9ACTN|nr:serine protease [Acrocarpospora macrocephala]
MLAVASAASVGAMSGPSHAATGDVAMNYVQWIAQYGKSVMRLTKRSGLRAVAAGVVAVSPLLGLLSMPSAALAVGGEVLNAGAPGTIEGSYIVVLKDLERGGAGVRAVGESLASQYGGQVARTYGHALQGFSVTMSEADAERLAADPAVSYVEQNRKISIAAGPETEIVQQNPPWGLDRIDKRSKTRDSKYNYVSGYTGSGVRSYVLDTGIRVTHAEFGGRATTPQDFVGDGRNGNDCHGHGTHVAATIAGATYGVAKNASVVGIRVLDCEGAGTYEGVLAGIDWVTANAIRPAVVNMSLGGPASQSMDEAVRGAVASGLPFVVAAGNLGCNVNGGGLLCNENGYSPARVAEAITVAASDKDDLRAHFSNFGNGVDINAPGVDVKSAWIGSNTATNTISGTSMAAPHVSGAVARLLVTHPNATPSAIALALKHNSHRGSIGEPDEPYDPQPPIPAETDPVVQTTGDLLHTSWQAQPLSTCVLSGTNANNITIPDVGPGTMSPINVTGCAGVGYVQPLHVSYTVFHTRPDDIRIDLVAPDGTRYRLRTEGPPVSTPNASPEAISATLNVNVNETARNGNWRLDVQDLWPDNFGYLDTWNLKF